MKTMPINMEKLLIHETISNYCNDNSVKRVFSLIGSDAGMVSLLDDSIDVVSAELQKDVYIMQCYLYPKYKKYLSDAAYALYIENPFDVIWLDFFGNMSEDTNYNALVIASNRLSTGGRLYITSNARVSRKVKLNPTLTFSILKLNCIDQYQYTNGKSKMTLYTLTKQQII